MNGKYFSLIYCITRDDFIKKKNTCVRERETYTYHPVILIAPFTLLSRAGTTVRPLVRVRDTLAISPREILVDSRC